MEAWSWHWHLSGLGNYCKERLTVNNVHVLDLIMLLNRIDLHDTETVDPEVSFVKHNNELHRIQNDTRNLVS
jgi:hypothetical protein